MNDSEITELPVDEFSHIKFNVDTYINADAVISGEITDLPADEYSYLKFDVSKFIAETASSTDLSELPESE
jgi:hypothetical protein